jgi:type II restriction enzyme
MTNNLNKTEITTLDNIRDKYYMKPVLSRINKFIETGINKKLLWKKMFDEIHTIMVESKKDVDKLLVKREKAGEIKSKDQARKSIAGAVFSNTIVYIFIKNKELGAISKDIFITSKYKNLKGFEKISTIHVDKETQKPDCDLVIYKLKENEQLDKCMIVSLKTIINKKLNNFIAWILLLEIIKNDCETRRKFNITFKSKYFPYIALINQNNVKQKKSNNNIPINLFDNYFVADNNNLKGNKLSGIVNFLNSNFHNPTLCLK